MDALFGVVGVLGVLRFCAVVSALRGDGGARSFFFVPGVLSCVDNRTAFFFGDLGLLVASFSLVSLDFAGEGDSWGEGVLMEWRRVLVPRKGVPMLRLSRISPKLFMSDCKLRLPYFSSAGSSTLFFFDFPGDLVGDEKSLPREVELVDLRTGLTTNFSGVRSMSPSCPVDARRRFGCIVIFPCSSLRPRKE